MDSTPVIISIVASGTITIFERMNQTGNLLKNITVRGSVPSCAIIVTAADCQMRSGMK